MQGELDRIFCYFRNLVYTTFREARHLGTKGHHPKYETCEEMCRDAKRQEDQWRVFSVVYGRIREEGSVAGIVKPFEELLGLTMNDLPVVFGTASQWRTGYGGEKWRAIADLAVTLAEAMQEENWTLANELCDEVRRVEHNSGPLVDPSKPYKWKEDCDN